MLRRSPSCRDFLGASGIGLMAGASPLADPARAAAQALGVKPADLPNLTTEEVKADVMGRGQLASLVSDSGIGGSYRLGNRSWQLNWSSLGWLEYAKGGPIAECFGMECSLHKLRRTAGPGVNFHCELAMPKNLWFQMACPNPGVERSTFFEVKDIPRIAKVDHATLDKLTKRIDRSKGLAIYGCN